jgi:hypothetical protein
MYDEAAERHAHGWCYHAATQLSETSFVRNATCCRAEEEIDDLPDYFKAIASHLVDSAASIVSASDVPELPNCNADAGDQCGTAHMMQYKLAAIKAACVLSGVMYLVSGSSNQCMLKRPQLTRAHLEPARLPFCFALKPRHSERVCAPQATQSIRPDVSVPVDPLHRRALTQFVALSWRRIPTCSVSAVSSYTCVGVGSDVDAAWIYAFAENLCVTASVHIVVHKGLPTWTAELKHFHANAAGNVKRLWETSLELLMRAFPAAAVGQLRHLSGILSIVALPPCSGEASEARRYASMLMEHLQLDATLLQFIDVSIRTFAHPGPDDRLPVTQTNAHDSGTSRQVSPSYLAGEGATMRVVGGYPVWTLNACWLSWRLL